MAGCLGRGQVKEKVSGFDVLAHSFILVVVMNTIRVMCLKYVVHISFGCSSKPLPLHRSTKMWLVPCETLTVGIWAPP